MFSVKRTQHVFCFPLKVLITFSVEGTQCFLLKVLIMFLLNVFNMFSVFCCRYSICFLFSVEGTHYVFC